MNLSCKNKAETQGGSRKANNLPFVKMHGLGNDFVMMRAEDIPVGADLSCLAAYVADRKFGIGSDGLAVIAPPSDPARFDTQFIFYNSDGSRAEMCGNGIRCFALYVRDRGLVAGDSFRVETLAGLMVPKINPDETVTVDMGPPILPAQAIPFQDHGVPAGEPVIGYPLQVLDRTLPVTLVSMGNPHCMIFLEDLDAPVDPAVLGPAIETHPAFPAKTNVEFVDVQNRRNARVTVWERGCGFTLACGTGACASAVAAVLLGKTDPQVAIHLPGGMLTIHWDREGSGHVLMTGPAAYVFEGTVTVPADVLAGR